ncbi:MAG: hypothetical protein Q9198_000536 [Flavoplaca austrocitrina]
MSAAEAHAKRGSADERDLQSPSPDLSQHDFYNPSRGSYLPDIVIPSTEIYGSATPSPLSPITPPDRLSPIEEVDDSASLRSTKVPGPAAFKTGVHHGLHQPRARPKSTEFDLQSSEDSNGRDILSIETRTEMLFSRQHLEFIFADRELSTRFANFLRTYRPDSVPILGYYLETIKALKTLKYAEAMVKSLERIPGLEFTADSRDVTMTWVLEDKADRALDILTQNVLPAFIAYVYVYIVDLVLVERVTGTEDAGTRDVAIGLAEVFTISGWFKYVSLSIDERGTHCHQTLQDPIIHLYSHQKVRRTKHCPARQYPLALTFAQPNLNTFYQRATADNASEFHRMTQYPSNIALGRNCRFLGGPKTDPNAISRFKASLQGEREHCEVMVN